ncbi:hypothetical protein GGS23DRAFT_560895 [Durotheca rogersii]|uniref:uncharacterized protein n=1 Tax=Durotheca rogersii TaxID=419775 RepID=UPI002220D9D7|nr:uncharacterized protein GGS23DRAFT_560895 [Durotheca rogersii]KAI5864590.1 hypothetical protein GGS23DRAFT_560895 [Durotheca rogersii]
MQRTPSEQQLSSTFVSDDPYYGGQNAHSEDHHAPYIPYTTPTITPNTTSENMMGFPGQQLLPAQISNSSLYVVGGRAHPGANAGVPGGVSFTTAISDPFEYPLYQAVTPESRTVDSTDAYRHGYSRGYGTVAPSRPASSSSAGSGRGKHRHASRPRRPRNQQVFSPGSSSSTSNASKSRLRSASRTSKNTHHNPPATVEEQKTRETHNQVEKQYRNRLNAHFESLLDALPETMQAGEGEGGGEALDLTDRRVSKAEVLDMARRHIQALERECSALEEERDELRDNMDKLRWLFSRFEGTDGLDERTEFMDTGTLQ